MLCAPKSDADFIVKTTADFEVREFVRYGDYSDIMILFAHLGRRAFIQMTVTHELLEDDEAAFLPMIVNSIAKWKADNTALPDSFAA